MTHHEHVHLIHQAIPHTAGIWADFGSGSGAFTLALYDLNHSEIYSIDQDSQRLTQQKHEFTRKFPNAVVHYMITDFTKLSELPKLDGILMANSLHYVENQVGFLAQIKSYLKSAARIVIVEYNIEKPNPWIPYPVNFNKFAEIAAAAGYTDSQFSNSVPSDWSNEMYCAATFTS